MAVSNMQRYKTVLNKVFRDVENNFYNNTNRRVFSTDYVRVLDIWLWCEKALFKKSGNIVMFEEGSKVYIGFKVTDILFRVDIGSLSDKRLGNEFVDVISSVERNPSSPKYVRYKNMLGDLTTKDIHDGNYDKMKKSQFYIQMIKQIDELNASNNQANWSLESGAFKTLKSRRDVYPLMIFDFDKNEVNYFKSYYANTSNSNRESVPIFNDGKANRALSLIARNVCETMPVKFVEYSNLKVPEDIYIATSGTLA